MSVFSVPVTIGIDEEKIAKEIESNVETRVVDRIQSEVANIIYTKRGYYDRDDKAPLKMLVREEVCKCIEVNEEAIITEAAKQLVEKMSRTKVFKEAVKEVSEQVAEGGLMPC